MKPHYIKANKRNASPNHLVFYDTETEPSAHAFGEIHTLKLGWARYVYLKNGIIKTDKWLRFTSAAEFWSWVEALASEKSRIWLVSHNQHFDFNVLGGFEHLPKHGWKITRMVLDSDTFILGFRKNRKSLLFIDSLNYVKAPLERLGQTIGLEKLNVDFNTVSLEGLSDYCHRDVEILSEYMLRLMGWWRKNNYGNFSMTASQLAFNAYKHSFMQHKIVAHHRPEIVALEEASYRGGRVECFKLGKFKGEFVRLDVNSMYPYIMRTCTAPVKPLKILGDLNPSQLEAYIQRYLAIAECSFETDKPAIAVKREKLIFPVGRIAETLTTPELAWLLKFGKIHKVGKCVLYEHAHIFRDYVDHFYRLKRESEETGDTCMRAFSKMLLNSLYGKFGQRVREYEPFDIPAARPYGCEWFIDASTRERFKILYLDGKGYRLSKDRKLFADAFLAIASHITAYARMYLWFLIERAGVENVYYVDTDSLIVNRDGWERLKTLNGPLLGLLKDEGAADTLEIRAPKDYSFGQEVKRKGIKPTDIMLAEGLYLQERFMKSKTALSKGLTQGVIQHNVLKHMNYEYDKGEVLPNGDVKPFRLQEF